MSESYVGIDRHSVDATFTIPDDGDDVNAASVDPAFQQTADNWQHAITAYPDLYTGGDYSALTAEVTVGNPFVFKGGIFLLGGTSYVTADGAFRIGSATLGAGLLEVLSGSQLQIDVGGGGLQLGTWTKSGTAAWTINRVHTIATGTNITGFHPESFDVVLITTGGFSLGLADPATSNSGSTPLPEGFRCTLSLVGNPLAGQSTTTVANHTGTTITSISATGGGNLTGAYLDIMTVNNSGTIVWAALGIAVGV